MSAVEDCAEIPQAKRDELRASRAKATPGVWAAVQVLHAENAIAIEGFELTRLIADVRDTPDECGRIADVRTDPKDYGLANARYIAIAANSVIEVLDALEAVEAQRDALAEELRAVRQRAGE
ncbi:Uncharacterised protein [Mycobacteroides abscessus subsp. abscessus]|uniref:hypothetical protein n=1 Tax=Mycobacteroides abscessus TaxID=36809 RepID=UPI0009285A02|nr:hypothetical protein [Mycobacteroides abscessus]SIH25817.1 Uncharacterised protein [Mycobacteroides abscessus subsp. abscessus]